MTKRRSFIAVLFLLVTVFYTHQMRSYSPCKDLTDSPKRTAIIALLGIYSTYYAYRSWCHRAIRLQAQAQPAQCKEERQETVWIFVHGIADNHKQVEKYKITNNEHGFVPTAIDSCLFNDACDNLRNMYQQSQRIPWQALKKIACSSLAQNSEVEKLHELVQKYDDKNLILFGVSRGASTIINYLALHKPGNVKAVILESPFDSVYSIVNGFLAKLYVHWIPGLTTCGDLLCAGIFKNYSTCKIAPCDVMEYIPCHIPILIICSEEDKLVPAASSKLLYQMLANLNHPHVSLIVAPTGKHGHIITGDSAQLYRNGIEKFLGSIGQKIAE